MKEKQRKEKELHLQLEKAPNFNLDLSPTLSTKGGKLKLDKNADASPTGKKSKVIGFARNAELERSNTILKKPSSMVGSKFFIFELWMPIYGFVLTSMSH